MFELHVTLNEIANNGVIICEETLGTMINEHLLLPNNAMWLQIKNLWYLSDQNSNFGGAQRVTTKNAVTSVSLSHWDQV